MAQEDKTKKFKIKGFLINFVNSIINHPYKTLVVVFIFWFLEWRWGFEASFFITLFFLFLLLKWDFRILISFALLFLLSCPFYLIVEDKFRAEQMAIYAYYLLFIGTILALFKQIKWPRVFKKNKRKRKKTSYDIKKDIPVDSTKR